ncbi:MAG: hypothetical protein ACFE9M_11760 [Promethearchaeota archaeon]
MGAKEESKSKLTNSKVILFGFELSRAQSALLLIISFIGILYLPYTLIGEVLYNLFQTLFVNLPFYFSHTFPEFMRNDFWFYYFFASHIVRIIVTTILLYLSIYTLKTILRLGENKGINKRKIIEHDRIVKWFGFKLSQGQSLFIFVISTAGILLAFQNIIDFFTSHDFTLYFFFKDLCSIPTGPNMISSHEILINTIPIIFNAIIILLSLYSLIKMRQGRTGSTSRNPIKNYALIIYISSLIVFLLFLMRCLCHLFLFTSLGNLLGIIPDVSNSYQTNDLVIVIIFLIVSLVLMIGSHFIREGSYEDKAINKELTWFHIRLTPKRAIVLISLAIVYVIFFTDFFLTFIFNMAIFNFPHPSILIFISIGFSISAFCYYPIEKILRRGRFNNYVGSIDNSELLVSKWFRFRLDRLYSLLLLSVSCGFLFIQGFTLISMNLSTQMILFMFEHFYFYYLISIPGSLVIVGALFAINIYTIIRTIHSIRPR